MEQPKTVNWRHVQYCKYNAVPHFAMLRGQMSKLTKARLIGQRREEGTQWYNIVYDREYLIQYIIIRLLMPLGVTDKNQVDKLIDEAWQGYLTAIKTPTEKLFDDESSRLFAANEISHETK